MNDVRFAIVTVERQNMTLAADLTLETDLAAPERRYRCLCRFVTTKRIRLVSRHRPSRKCQVNVQI